MNRTKAIEKIRDLIRDVPIAMLTTITQQGLVHSRPMAAQKIPIQDELLFLADERSAKISEIQETSSVGVTYTDQDVFVSISGRCKVSNDRALIKALWMPIFNARFPGGVDNPEVRVLHIGIETAEYWEIDPQHHTVNERLLP